MFNTHYLQTTVSGLTHQIKQLTRISRDTQQEHARLTKKADRSECRAFRVKKAHDSRGLQRATRSRSALYKKQSRLAASAIEVRAMAEHYQKAGAALDADIARLTAYRAQLTQALARLESEASIYTSAGALALDAGTS